MRNGSTEVDSAQPMQDTPETEEFDGVRKYNPWFFEKGFWKQWLIFHSSQTVKLGYSFLSELIFMLYFSFYIRNWLLYSWTGYDWMTIGIIILMMFGRFKATWPEYSRQSWK